MKKNKKKSLLNSFSIMVVSILGIVGFSLGSIIFNTFSSDTEETSSTSTQRRCEECSLKAGVDVFHDIDSPDPETEEVWCETHQRFETRAKNASESK